MIKFLKYFLASLLFTGVACAQTVSPFVGGTVPAGYFSTYGVAITNQQPAASATDINCITGSATRTIYVRSIRLTGSNSAGAVGRDIQIVKRSTADTGGTPSNATVVPHDSFSAAATATVTSYITNPTTGNAVGNVASVHAAFPVTTASVNVTVYDFPFGREGSTSLVLHGVNEQVCVNMFAAGAATDSLHTTYEWIEQ